MDIEGVIDELAEELGATAVARKKWRQRGVPYRWRLPIIERAAKRGIKLAGADFERAQRKRAA